MSAGEFMVNAHLEVALDAQGAPTGDYRVVLTLSPEADAHPELGQRLRATYQTQLLAGRQRRLRDGRCRYFFTLSPAEGAVLKEALVRLVFPLSSN